MSLKLYCYLSLLFFIGGCVANSPNSARIPTMIDAPKNFSSFLNTNNINIEVVFHGFASGTVEEGDGIIRQVTGDFWKAEFVYKQPAIIWFKQNNTSSFVEQCKGFDLSPDDAVQMLFREAKKHELMIIELKDDKKTQIVLNVKKDLFGL